MDEKTMKSAINNQTAQSYTYLVALVGLIAAAVVVHIANPDIWKCECLWILIMSITPYLLAMLILGILYNNAARRAKELVERLNKDKCIERALVISEKLKGLENASPQAKALLSIIDGLISESD